MFPKESKQITRDNPTPMKPSSIDWRVPTLMTVSLLLGVLLAIGHHLFYNSLHGTFVESDNQQIWNLRIGTGLAFLIKVCLTTAVSIACVQHFWLLLRQRALPLSSIDAFFDVLTNGASLLDLRIWHQGPVIILLAVIVWFDTPGLFLFKAKIHISQVHSIFRHYNPIHIDNCIRGHIATFSNYAYSEH